jgi:hypothetical protein
LEKYYPSCPRYLIIYYTSVFIRKIFKSAPFYFFLPPERYPADG